MENCSYNFKYTTPLQSQKMNNNHESTATSAINSASKKRKQSEKDTTDQSDTSTSSDIIELSGDETNQINTISTTAPKHRAIAAFSKGIQSLHGPVRDDPTVTKISKLFVENLIRLEMKKKKIARFTDDSYIPHSVRINCKLNGSHTVTTGEAFQKLYAEFETIKDAFIAQAKTILHEEQKLEQQMHEDELVNQVLDFAKTLIVDDILARKYAEHLEDIDDKEVNTLLVHSIQTNVKTWWTPLLFGKSDDTICKSLIPIVPENLSRINNKYKGVSARICGQLNVTFGAALAAYESGLAEIKIAENMARNRANQKLNKVAEQVLLETEKIQSNLDADTIKTLVKEAITQFTSSHTAQNDIHRGRNNTNHHGHHRQNKGNRHKSATNTANNAPTRHTNNYTNNNRNHSSHRHNNHGNDNYHNNNGNSTYNNNSNPNYNNGNGNQNNSTNRRSNNTRGTLNRNNNNHNNSQRTVRFNTSVKGPPAGRHSKDTNVAPRNGNRKNNRNSRSY